MNKNLITKISIIIFTMWISFAWLNFVSAEDIYNPCFQYGCVFPSNPSQQDPRFNNTKNSLKRCQESTDCVNHIKLWKESNFDNMLGSLFGLTSAGCSETSAWDPQCFIQSQNIGSLQEKMQTIWCLDYQNSIDNMMGWDTLHDIVNCCIWENELLPNMSWSAPTCDEWESEEPNDKGQKCCVKPQECTTTIEADPSEYMEWEDTEIDVVVTFISDAVFERFNSSSSFEVEWWTKTPDSCISADKKCTFIVTPDEWGDPIIIKSPEWRAIFATDILCDEAEAIVQAGIEIEEEEVCKDPLIKVENRFDCCMPRDKRNLCDTYYSNGIGQSPALPEDPIKDYSLLDEFECEKDGAQYAFCSCKTPTKSNLCEDYWTWYFNNNWCCEECVWDQKVNSDWTGCDCALNDEKCWEWKKEENCKCVCDSTKQCCWIKLNTVVPFIGDCIEMTTQNTTHTSNWDNTSNVNQLNAFPFLMMGLSKILVTVILIFSFLIVIAAGLMMVTWVYEEWNYKKWMDRIKKVVVALILLWSSGLILKLINPSFFWG